MKTAMPVNPDKFKPLGIKDAKKNLREKGKQGGWITKEDVSSLRNIKEDPNIYNNLDAAEREFFDILREGVENDFTIENRYRITSAGEEGEDSKAKQKARIKKLNGFLDTHSKFNNHVGRNGLIGFALLLTLAAGVITKAKMDDNAFGKEQDRLRALREQEKKQDRSVLAENAVRHIRDAEDRLDIDDVVTKYSDIIQKKRDTLRMQNDSVFSEAIKTTVAEFEQAHPEEAKSFFSKFLDDKLSGEIYAVDVRQLEHWENPYQQDLVLDDYARDFLQDIADQVASYQLHGDKIGTTYAEFISNIKKAKSAKYAELGISEEQEKKEEKKSPTPSKEAKEKSEGNYKLDHPMYMYNEVNLISKIILGETNVLDLENWKTRKAELEKKIRERDSIKKEIEKEKDKDMSSARREHKNSLDVDVSDTYKEAGEENRGYTYAKILFINALLENKDYERDYQSATVSYGKALLDSLTRSPEMQQLKEIIEGLKEGEAQEMKDDSTDIQNQADADKEKIDNQYFTDQEDLAMLKKLIGYSEETFRDHIKTLGSILKKNSPEEFHQRKNVLSTDYNVSPENIKELIEYRLDAMFFSYSFEDGTVLNNFPAEVENISKLTGLSKKSIYFLAARYIQEDLNIPGEYNRKQFEAWLSRLGIKV